MTSGRRWSVVAAAAMVLAGCALEDPPPEASQREEVHQLMRRGPKAMPGSQPPAIADGEQAQAEQEPVE